MGCTLCAGDLEPFASDKRRDYLRCNRCLLVQVPAGFHLDVQAEKDEYDKHENHYEDEGYRGFLSRMLTPMLEALKEHPAEKPYGLDFGCGPEPVLQRMFADHGVEQTVFDLYYANEPNRLADCEYDFITSTEVIEHLGQPGEELQRLWSLLKPGGLLGIMTKRVSSPAAFENWHYKNDPTHICFFSSNTFDYLARQWGANLHYPSSDVVIFRKSVN